MLKLESNGAKAEEKIKDKTVTFALKFRPQNSELHACWAFKTSHWDQCKDWVQM